MLAVNWEHCHCIRQERIRLPKKCGLSMDYLQTSNKNLGEKFKNSIPEEGNILLIVMKYILQKNDIKLTF
jgi:hypothetical protein